VLGDEANLVWHRQCLAQNGAELYRWAVDSTRRAQARGKVGKPGAYFTSLLRRRGRPVPAGPDPLAAAPVPEAAPPPTPLAPAAVVAEPPVGPAVRAAGLSEADCGRVWQAALVYMRTGLPADDYSRILRYAVLLELDPASGWALIGLPTDYMREQVAGRLAGAIALGLSQICGATVRVAAALLPGQGRLAGSMPTLATRGAPPADCIADAT
ncbi:MAG TPA: hypothetical protein VKY74_19650, partial [Chloroflexia bacterium]|nr:hypothetical protein [Chloroflexia bacterium]